MAITFKNNKFHLSNDSMSYIIKIGSGGDLLNLYFGKSVNADDMELPERPCQSFSIESPDKSYEYSRSIVPFEYPSAGAGDYRSPAYEIMTDTGMHTPSVKYVKHEIVKGKPPIPSLPAVYTESDSEAETLIITAEDKDAGIEIRLFYTLFEGMNVLCRHAEIKNVSRPFIYLNNAQSVSLDFPAGNYEYIHLEGAWAREKHIEAVPVHKGTQGFESRRGASGHVENPFMAFYEQGANEDFGNVYGISLIYSGNHKFSVEVEGLETVRVQAGINPFCFSYRLEKGESFTTPEAVIVFSENGFAQMSKTFHQLYRERLCRGKFRDSVRPILINNWEATYFNFNKEKLLAIADSAAKIGLELFVLDDGWFGVRDDDTTSLGDWFVNHEKLGCSIAELAEEINKRGLKFGLWFEPEMVSEKSKLYEQHPDWAIQVPGIKPQVGRQQLILDYTRAEVRDYIVKVVSDVLKSANIEYVKWDMNRNMSDVYSAALAPEKQGEFYHRYILGLYDVLERITSTFPNILFEGCSGGGGRNDPGMLYYMPQNWASDDTDAVERLYIQYGGSFVYPASTVGSHVSAVPNHQVGRITSLSMRGTVAMNGAFGYELDLSKLSEEELCEMKEQVETYKRIREIVMKGDFYRLANPFKTRYSSWMYVNADKSKAVFYYAVKQARPTREVVKIRLKGLDESARYSVGEKEYTGKTLMNYGITMKSEEHDCDNLMLEINRI